MWNPFDTLKSVFTGPLSPAIGGAFGSVLGPVGGILGGGLGQQLYQDHKISQEQDWANQQWQKNYDAQKEFAQNSLRWKIADGVAAGLSPLAASGGGGSGYSPSAVAVDFGSSGADMARMGQDIGRAIFAGKSADDRSQQLQDLQLENFRLQNEGQSIQNAYYASSLARLGSSPPPAPASENPAVNPVPLNVTMSRSGVEQGAIPDVGFTTQDGYLYPVPSKDVKERTEDSFIPETAWAIRNYGYRSGQPNIKDYPLPKGYTHWRWSALNQRYEPARPDRRDIDDYERKQQNRRRYGADERWLKPIF